MRTLAASILRLGPFLGVLTISAPLGAADPYLAPWYRVTSFTFEANLANWDADAAPDGLGLYVQPVNAWGAPVDCASVVHVELVAPVRRPFAAAPHSRGAVCETLARWTKNLAASLPTDNGYLVKLPFPSGPPLPKHLAGRGCLYVRLVVPGQGVFEFAREGVVLLP
jgi:hypothetical protein